jgi:hypothetical protein
MTKASKITEELEYIAKTIHDSGQVGARPFTFFEVSWDDNVSDTKLRVLNVMLKERYNKSLHPIHCSQTTCRFQCRAYEDNIFTPYFRGVTNFLFGTEICKLFVHIEQNQ